MARRRVAVGLAVVDTDDAAERGRRLKERRMRHDIKSLRELAEKTGVDRQAIARAEAGQASSATYDRLEAWFDRFEEEIGDDDAGGDQVEIEVRDIVGIGQVIYRGPAGDVPEFEAMLERLIERQRRAGRDQ